MIRLNLTQRIWFSFIAILLLVGLLIGVIYPISLNSTLTEETYRIIEQEQTRYANPYGEHMIPPNSELDFIERRDAERSVGHLFLMNQMGTLEGDPVPNEVLNEMGENAQDQMGRRGRYELTYNDATLFYVVFKVYTTGGEAYHISYMWDTYRDEMVNRLWTRLSFIMVLAGLLSLVPAFWLKHYLKAPLNSLGSHFEQISERNWREPFRWEGDQDFEKLSNQFEKMRQNLIKYDSAQKTFIQHASHELKTPIMVVKSYAQSVKDGILPKGNMQETMDVILEESNRMEKRVKDMLYYTKLDSLKEAPMEPAYFKFGTVAYEMEERFLAPREELVCTISGDNITVYADQEQISVALENLIENALRYAVSEIHIKADRRGRDVYIEVYNDGDPIPEEELDYLFTPFRKGNKGQFGLGLAIVERIADIHQGKADVVNEEDGVRFRLIIPQN
ncbi:sensor histidine kinase [Salisediminibacterium halotolerans]|uniref:histidine kinase n=1 Tax=Salisediminibacterium halotolerans TaxID=517425 RepID=A0A1H9THQ5_9BACI|nr:MULTISPECIES: HAMP domain-containing sensor histidine kinase [Salisediminibacterium]RLJ72389.1 two-component system sensor histidine kinase CssS [Actinophytocola xinjiangensis]RPE85604.1 two-component system sensor histidine kinase CssS [Salisediminibacterium halotolerans]TWG33558.1 two-component system sensor histidine kinase CssS [Salisediminibacterium halotolerans]SER96514.1 two-component system, OmpR family, sensor histidine kinase CssS [Salisediminibacterium haloalkalitolerans]GEL08714